MKSFVVWLGGWVKFEFTVYSCWKMGLHILIVHQ